MQPINSPIRWVGGKSRTRKHIIPLIPPHTCFVDLFCGGAWVMLGKPPSRVDVINDIDTELVNFFRVIRNRPEEFIASFDLELVSRDEYRRQASLDPDHMGVVERAHRFYYLLMAGWGGEIGHPRFQTSITDGGGGNRLIGAISSLRSRITPVYQRLQTVIIECLDWKECLDRYDSPTTVFYADPPYQGNKCNYANNMTGKDEHDRLHDALDSISGSWILSAYDSPSIRLRFSGHAIVPIRSASGMPARSGRHVNREVLIVKESRVP